MSEQTPDQQIVIVGPDGRPVAMALPPGEGEGADGPGSSVVGLVEQPAKVMRIGSMIKQLLEEVRTAPLDEAGRARLRAIHERSIKELEAGLAPELVDELERISLPFGEDTVPSEAELRIAQAQLVGWLEGCSTASRPRCSPSRWQRAQFEEMRRRALPAGAPESHEDPGDAHGRPANGPYL